MCLRFWRFWAALRWSTSRGVTACVRCSSLRLRRAGRLARVKATLRAAFGRGFALAIDTCDPACSGRVRGCEQPPSTRGPFLRLVRGAGWLGPSGVGPPGEGRVAGRFVFVWRVTSRLRDDLVALWLTNRAHFGTE